MDIKTIANSEVLRNNNPDKSRSALDWGKALPQYLTGVGLNKTGNARINVTLRRVRANTVAVEMQ